MSALTRTPSTGSENDLRTARLLFDAELAADILAERALSSPQVRVATHVRDIPLRPVRLAQQVRYKRRSLDFESAVMTPLNAARRAVLGKDGAAPPRFLIRVDEFPHYQAWDEPGRFGTSRFERLHEIMTGAGVPYLLAVLPRVSREPLSLRGTDSRPLADEEIGMLRRVSGEGVCFALHGRDHRTRFASPRRHSELCGLDHGQTEQLIDGALAELVPHGIEPRVFVPPFNRFDAQQWDLLAHRFEVICGGPESIGLMGFQRTPQWRGKAVYLPSYAPFYGRAAEVLPAVERAIDRAVGLWVPVVLHWGWEAQADWRDLERLAGVIAPYAVAWEELLAAITRSQDGASPGDRDADLERDSSVGHGSSIGTGPPPP
ncbi:MAG: DUF2334 domain-containing protein [Solirubrobacteraceae bacterium]